MRLMRMKQWRRAWARRLRILVLPACVLALAVPAGAHAAPSQGLRSPNAGDAARAAQAQAQVQAQRAVGQAQSPTRVIESTGSGDQTLPLALASAAIGIALAGLAVGLGALLRRPRSRWSVN
jgi:hypothetical protein